MNAFSAHRNGYRYTGASCEYTFKNMAAQGFAPLFDQKLKALSYSAQNGNILGFAAFKEIVLSLQLWVEANYEGFAAEESFKTKTYPGKGETLADAGNLAWVWAQISGITVDWPAFSTNSKMPKNKRARETTEDFSGPVSKNQKTKADFGWLSGGTMKENHTEPKLLVEMQNYFNLDPNTSNGYIIIVSSRDVCGSCRKIITAFATTFPHIIVYGLGLGQIGRFQKDVKEEHRISTRMRSGSISDDLPAIQASSQSVKPLQLLCFHGAGVTGGVFTA